MCVLAIGAAACSCDTHLHPLIDQPPHGANSVRDCEGHAVEVAALATLPQSREM
jgi:hypothetical protein